MNLRMLRATVAVLYGVLGVLSIIFVILLVDRFPIIRELAMKTFARSAENPPAFVEQQGATREDIGVDEVEGVGDREADNTEAAPKTNLRQNDRKDSAQRSNHPSGSSSDAGSLSQSAGGKSNGLLPSLSPTAFLDVAQKRGISPEKISPELVPLLEKVLVALERHDTDSARALLREGQGKARNNVDKAKIERWVNLCDVLDEFWRVMGQIVGHLQPLQVIPVGETEVLVVENRSDQLTIRVSGQNRSYALRAIPPSLVKHLAEKHFSRSPQSKIVLATYLAVEPKGDREASRRLLLEAIGAGVDPGDFVLELAAFLDKASLQDFIPAGSVDDMKAFVSSGGVPPQTATTVSGEPATPAQQATGTHDPSKLSPDDDEDKVGAGAATSANVAKARLAKKRLEEATDSKIPISERLMKVDEARQIAEEIGDVALVLNCIEVQSRYRQIDRLREMTGALQDMAQRFDSRDVRRTVTQAALRLAREAVQNQRLQEAHILLDTAAFCAKEIGSRPLLQEALVLKKMLESGKR